MSKTNNRTLMLNLFLPYRMVNLATEISNACSKIYKTDFDISMPEWRVLARLAEHDKLNGKDIGQATFMDKSKVSRALKILEEKELILSSKNGKDNRATYFRLSDQGQNMYGNIAPKALDWEEQLIDALDVSEYRDLMRILEKLDRRVAEMDVKSYD
jgi:DNA-binding MarR family transcriptional regulator